MKPKIILLIAQLSLTAAQTNAQTPPKEGFELLMSVSELSLKRGRTDSVEFSVLRSRSFKSGNAVFGLSSPGIEGIEVRMQWTPGTPDTCLLIITAKEGAEPGDYNIIPSCTLSNRKRGAILKVKVL